MWPEQYTKKISKAFGDHAGKYDANSSIQKKIAETLITYCPDLGKTPQILEIGCGTGHLTQLLLEKYSNANFVITDINPDMLNVCKDKYSSHSSECSIEFTTMDGEGLGVPLNTFDLIVSSMTVQWFHTPRKSVEAWTDHLRPDGQILISTLADGYFPQWREAEDRSGVMSRLIPAPNFPNQMSIDHVVFEENYSHAKGFLEHLKSTGASSSSQNCDVLGRRELGLLMKAYDSKYDGEMTWKIAFGKLAL